MRHSSINNHAVHGYLVPRLLTWLAVLFILVPHLSAQTMTTAESDSGSDNVAFDAVQPILRKHCVRCHNEDQPRGDLVLSSLDKVLAGSSSGPVVIAGKLDESPLYTLTAHLDTPKMPPNKPQIPQRELNIIERWIVSGLANESMPAAPKQLEPSKKQEIENRTPATPSQSVYSALRAIPQASAVQAIASHPSEPVVVLAGLHQVAVLNTSTSMLASQAIEIGEKNVSALRFSPDGKILLIAAGVVGESGKVLVLDWMTKQWLPSVGEETDNIQSIDCNADASQIAIGTTTRTVKTLDRMTQKELRIHRKHTDWVLSISYSHDGLLIASGDRFGGIHVWEAESGNEFATLRGHTGGITGLVWSSDGDQLTSASLDGSVRVWNMHTLETVKQWTAHERGVLSLASGSKESIFTTGRDGWIRRWGFEPAQLIGQSKLPEEAISVCGVGSPENPDAVVCTDAAGGIYRFSSLLTSESDTAFRKSIDWPMSKQRRVFASIAPAALKRVDKAASKDRTSESDAKVPKGPSTSEQRLGSGNSNAASDLEESRRALASIEQSLEQTYRTAEQLEESVARLKQLIALQEARLKQADLRQKPNRTSDH